MKNYIQPGKVVTIAAPKAVASGDIVVQGVLVGVAGHDADLGDPVDVHVEGVFVLAKTSAQAWTVGQAIHVVPGTGLATTAASTNIFIGVAIEAAANPSPTGVVRLNGAFPAAAGT